MTLGIVADEIDRDFAAAVRIGTELGLRRYEIRFLTTGRAPLCDVKEMHEVERIAAGEGVTITALSPGLFKMTDDQTAFDREMSEVYPRAAEWAHRWNLPGLITFGFHKPGVTEQSFAARAPEPVPGHVLDWLAAADERAQDDKLLLMIEPEPICQADTATLTAHLIEQTGAKNLRINYDPGNVAWLTGRDPIDDFPAAAPWIANVHVKDLRPFEPGVRPTFVPAGQGLIDFRAHFRALRQANYRGPISLEPHMDGSPATIRDCINAVENP
jgi:sugar phosphate isomerase/epimerase